MSRRWPCRRIFPFRSPPDDRFVATNLNPTLARPGHNPPVGVAFQFLLVGRLSIELNGRYSASKLMTALAQPGHNRSVTYSRQRTIKGLLHSET